MVSASTPTFTIIVPCFNYGRFVATTLESVVLQERDDIEVIVVDDASTDDSVAVARSFGAPVRVIELNQNSGPGAAWGAGIAAARGAYLCKLDADDWQLPGFLDRVQKEFERDERVGLVATGVYLYPDGEAAAFVQAPTSRDRILDESSLRRQLLRKFFVRMPGTALRRAALDAAKPRTDLRMGEDWEYFLRVLRGWRASLIAAPHAVYRIHPSSLTLTSQSSDRLRAELEHLLDLTGDPGDPGYLTQTERRRFSLGVAESYLGTVGPRLSSPDVRLLAHHLRVAWSLAADVDPLGAPLLLRYVLWGAWQRLAVRHRRATVPIESLRP